MKKSAANSAINSATRSYSSKILLFGEYSIILDSMALAIPCRSYSGRLVNGCGSISINSSSNGSSNSSNNSNGLLKFATYLSDLSVSASSAGTAKHSGLVGISQRALSLLQTDCQNNLRFFSNIPAGYGLGSSGALTAAIWDRYFASFWEQSELLELKQVLGQMESFFHGRSSGLDPLISYLDAPILIKSREQVLSFTDTDVSFTTQCPEKINFFLIDTGLAKKTGPLVNHFLERYKQTLSNDFKNHCDQGLIPITNLCIENFLAGEWLQLRSNFHQLSTWQYQHLAVAILPEVRSLWKAGLDSGDFSIKLCGSGGGGMLLGVTSDLSVTKDFFLVNYPQLSLYVVDFSSFVLDNCYCRS
ncbi:MAG: mevalonate kinase [Oligoflexia bacterium]|nr:mevalonate kinase [Oligoflexia bacterium]